jgi:hypothetical protein
MRIKVKMVYVGHVGVDDFYFPLVGLRAVAVHAFSGHGMHELAGRWLGVLRVDKVSQVEAEVAETGA